MAKTEQLIALFDGCPARNFLVTGGLTKDSLLANIVKQLEAGKDARLSWRIVSGVEATLNVEVDDNKYNISVSWPSTLRSPQNAQVCLNLWQDVVKFATQMELVLNSK